jgi:hypothetical protein
MLVSGFTTSVVYLISAMLDKYSAALDWRGCVRISEKATDLRMGASNLGCDPVIRAVRAAALFANHAV